MMFGISNVCIGIASINVIWPSFNASQHRVMRLYRLECKRLLASPKDICLLEKSLKKRFLKPIVLTLKLSHESWIVELMLYFDFVELMFGRAHARFWFGRAHARTRSLLDFGWPALCPRQALCSIFLLAELIARFFVGRAHVWTSSCLIFC